MAKPKDELKTLKIIFTHPDPKREKAMAHDFIKFAKTLGKITGEPVKIIKRSTE